MDEKNYSSLKETIDFIFTEDALDLKKAFEKFFSENSSFKVQDSQSMDSVLRLSLLV